MASVSRRTGRERIGWMVVDTAGIAVPGLMCSSFRSAFNRAVLAGRAVAWYGGRVPLVSLERVSHAYGHLPLLAEVALQIEPRERLSVVGRNGTGKSTLRKIVGREIAPDE